MIKLISVLNYNLKSSKQVKLAKGKLSMSTERERVQKKEKKLNL